MTARDLDKMEQDEIQAYAARKAVGKIPRKPRTEARIRRATTALNSARSAEKAKKKTSKTSQVTSGEKRRRLDADLDDAADNDDNNNYLDDLLDDDETPILEQDWSDHPNYSKILHKAVTACQSKTLSPSKREGAPKCLEQMATDLQITDLPKATGRYR